MIAAAALTFAAAPLAQAQQGGKGFLFKAPEISLTFRVGYDHAMAGSDLFNFVTTEHTVDRGDFSSLAYAADIGLSVSSRMELVFGVAFARTTTPSEFRQWVDNNDQPILQQTTFERRPITGSLKYYLTPRGNMVGHYAWVPARYALYLGAGGGGIHYEFKQAGDFIDYNTLRVFPDQFKSSGTTPEAHAFGGADVSLGTHVVMTAELRYTWARAGLGADYVGFERLDLSGLAATGGLSYRF